MASPTLYTGQVVRAALFSDERNTGAVDVGIQLQSYGEEDAVVNIHGHRQSLLPAKTIRLEWQIPDVSGAPIAQIGISISSDEPAEGAIHAGLPLFGGFTKCHFPQTSRIREDVETTVWVNAADFFEDGFGEAFRVIQNQGRGSVITGTREWTDYSVQANITPHMVKAFGLAARVQGLKDTMPCYSATKIRSNS